MARAQDRVYDSIRRRILEGFYEAGAHLVESELALELEASRTPVRGALQRLATEGLVDFAPNKGARVAQWSDEEIEQIFELRALLESHGAMKATPNISEEDIEELSELASHMESLVEEKPPGRDYGKIALLNNEFHAVILRAAGSEKLSALLSSLVHIPLIHQTFRQYTPEALARSFVHHRELIAAFEQRDPLWAESIMRGHILAGRVVLRAGRDAEEGTE